MPCPRGQQAGDDDRGTQGDGSTDQRADLKAVEEGVIDGVADVGNSAPPGVAR